MKHQENCWFGKIITTSRDIGKTCTCTPIESPEEKCEHCNGKVSSYRSGCPGCGAPMCCQSCCDKDNFPAPECKGTCEEEKGGWRCGKCDGADVPRHFRTCQKREKENITLNVDVFGAMRQYTMLEDFTNLLDSQQEEAFIECMHIAFGDAYNRVLRSELATARKEGREEMRREVIDIVKGQKIQCFDNCMSECHDIEYKTGQVCEGKSNCQCHSIQLRNLLSALALETN